jgi:hypothetical protein
MAEYKPGMRAADFLRAQRASMLPDEDAVAAALVMCEEVVERNMMFDYPREVLIEKGRWKRITGHTWGMSECDAMVEQLEQKHGITVRLGSVTDQGIDHCAQISKVFILW